MVAQSFSGKEFHGDEVLAVSFANFINGADIRVIQCGDGPCFTAKAFQGLAFACGFLVQEFQGHDAAEREVFGFVDIAHAAATDLFQDPIVRNSAAGWLTHRKAPDLNMC